MSKWIEINGDVIDADEVQCIRQNCSEVKIHFKNGESIRVSCSGNNQDTWYSNFKRIKRLITGIED